MSCCIKIKSFDHPTLKIIPTTNLQLINPITHTLTMKTQTLLLTALLAGAGFASAQTPQIVTNPIIYIGGSQAFSALDNAALSEYAANKGFTLAAYAGSLPATSAKALLYRKTNDPVLWAPPSRPGQRPQPRRLTSFVDIINVRQSGSEASIRSAAGNGNQLVSFLPDDASGQYKDEPASYSNLKPAAIGTSGVYQANSRWFAGKREGTSRRGFTYQALTEVKPEGGEPGIAAQVWGWSASANFPTNAANITSLTAQTLLQQGHVPLSYFSGNPADTNHGVWLIGRDIAAGARIAALVNVGYGSLDTVRQFRVFTNTGTVTLRIEPEASVDGVTVAEGNNGYDGTSSQRVAASTVVPSNLQVNFGKGLTNSPYTGTNYLIQYNSLANTVNQTNSSGNPTLIPLRFNGVAPDTNNNGVLSGAYTFWTYEHIYMTPTPPNRLTREVAQHVADYVGRLSSADMTRISRSVGYLSTKELNVFKNNDGTRIFRK